MVITNYKVIEQGRMVGATFVPCWEIILCLDGGDMVIHDAPTLDEAFNEVFKKALIERRIMLNGSTPRVYVSQLVMRRNKGVMYVANALYQKPNTADHDTESEQCVLAREHTSAICALISAMAAAMREVGVAVETRCIN